MTKEANENVHLIPTGFLNWPSDRGTDRFQDALYIEANFGTKVAGLFNLPERWVPPFVAIPSWVYFCWREDPTTWIERTSENGLDLARISEILPKELDLIVRSSAIGESMDDRGKYKSLVSKRTDAPSSLIEAITEIYQDFQNYPTHLGIAICVQAYHPSEIAGHVSNEVRLSATRNQWKYGVSYPSFAPTKGLNSKFADSPAEDSPLYITKIRDLSKLLRRVCHWINKRIDSRAHIEWCVSGGELRIVQLDQESPTSTGENPHQMPSIWYEVNDGDAPYEPKIFRRYRIQEDPPWRKLQNIRDFWTGVEPPRHVLYFATGGELIDLLNNEDGKILIIAEIDALTAGRAVLRTDCNDSRIPRFNLPRTNTVNGASAVDWMIDILKDMECKNVNVSDVAFIFHRYIPARAAAWSYHSVGEDMVFVDCLWGLPDGLQFLEHDSYQLDAQTGDELAADIPYKRHYLQEQQDGSWNYVKVARQFGRDRVLSREALRFIATQTVAIAHRIKEQAQVMWFCDIPTQIDLGDHLPWFRSKDFSTHSEVKRPGLQEWWISTVKDIRAFDQQASSRILRVDPDVELVRDDEAFLDQVIEVALRREAPVELVGSTLGHAYYKLRSAGVMIVSGRPTRRRIRKKQVFQKLVRDEMPAKIAAKGEQVSFGRLGKSDAVRALIGKLFEEGMELHGAGTPETRLEELADVLEVVRGIASMLGVSWDELDQVAQAKRDSRGGFENQTVLMETGRRYTQHAHEPRIEGQMDAQIPLREIGPVRTGEGFAAIPFTRLVAAPDVIIETPLNGRTLDLIMRTSSSGLEIHIRDKATQSEDGFIQPDLFENKSEDNQS